MMFKRNPVEFVAEKKDQFFILRKKDARVERICHDFLDNLDQLSEPGKIHKPGTRTHAVSLYISDEYIFIKRYNVRNFCYMLAHSLAVSRAERSWRASWKLKSLGIPVPEPLACLIERKMGILWRSYLLTKSISEASGLKFIWAHFDSEEKNSVLRNLGSSIGIMHRGGFFHGDLKWTNILLCRGTVENFFFIDFDSSSIATHPLELKKAEKDLARFLADLRDLEGSPSMEHLFLEAWSKKYRDLK